MISFLEASDLWKMFWGTDSSSIGILGAACIKDARLNGTVSLKLEPLPWR